MRSLRWVLRAQLLFPLLIFLLLGIVGGYAAGFNLGGIWGGILGIVIVPLLGVIGGIALIALIGSPLWIVPMLRRTFERFRSTIRQALGRPCSVSSSTKSNKSDRKWEANGDVDMELAFVVSMFSFFGVAGGWMWGEDYGLQHGNGLIQSFWIITGGFLGGFIGIIAGLIFMPLIWGLVKVLCLPYRVVSRIIRYVRSKKPHSL